MFGYRSFKTAWRSFISAFVHAGNFFPLFLVFLEHGLSTMGESVGTRNLKKNSRVGEGNARRVVHAVPVDVFSRSTNMIHDVCATAPWRAPRPLRPHARPPFPHRAAARRTRAVPEGKTRISVFSGRFGDGGMDGALVTREPDTNTALATSRARKNPAKTWWPRARRTNMRRARRLGGGTTAVRRGAQLFPAITQFIVLVYDRASLRARHFFFFSRPLRFRATRVVRSRAKYRAADEFSCVVSLVLACVRENTCHRSVGVFFFFSGTPRASPW